MKKEWGFIPKILSGKKKIESRWYVTRRAPWGKIKAGETIYFKNSGEPITARATVRKVVSFSDMRPHTVKAILARYGGASGFTERQAEALSKRYKDKKYCMLIHLKNPRSNTPFHIDKAGFGAMAAWLSVPDVRGIIRK